MQANTRRDLVLPGGEFHFSTFGERGAKTAAVVKSGCCPRAGFPRQPIAFLVAFLAAEQEKTVMGANLSMAAGMSALPGLQMLAETHHNNVAETGAAADVRSGKLKPRVLVVDDERLIADTTAEILNGNGFQATAAYDGRTALQLAKSSCPDTLITDVIMPVMNGVELAARVKRECPGTRVFLLSGQAATAALLERSRARGEVFELLPKPIRVEALLKKLAG